MRLKYNFSSDQFIGKVKSILWPIHKNELRKFIPMMSLFFLISLVYNMLRPVKSGMTVATQNSGAEIIAYLKVYAVLPGAFLFTFIYTKLLSRFDREKVFYMMISIFIAFYIAYVLFLYPNTDTIMLSDTAIWLENVLPTGFAGLINMLKYWHHSLFYASVELWGTVVLSMLFWGFANEVNTVGEATRFYAILSMTANFTAMLSSVIGKYIWETDFSAVFVSSVSRNELSLDLNIAIVVVIAILIMALFRWMNTGCKDIFREEYYSASKDKAKKPKMSLTECFRFVAKSPYLIYVAVIVFSYNVVYNMTDIIWSQLVKDRFPNDVAGFTVFQNDVQFYIGALAIVMAFLTSYIIRRFGWKFTALLTPIGLMVTSLSFFPLLIFKDTIVTDYALLLFKGILGGDILFITVMIATTQKIFTRACKFTVFDSSKEIAYIPICTDGKRKSKAAIDGIGSRMGKSGGSLMFQGLLISFSSMTAALPAVAVIIILITGIWIYSVLALSKEMNKLAESS